MKRVIFSVFCLVAATACSYEVYEPGLDGDYESQSSTRNSAEDVCVPYCLHLIDCGVLSDSAFLNCRELCVERHDADPEKVSGGCSCVQEAECKPEESSSCEGAPVPGPWDDDSTDAGQGGSDSGSVGIGGTGSEEPSASGGSSASSACSVNHDCEAGQDCLSGSCLNRCAASCQCDEGQACTNGYCEVPAAPAVECATDCDCTSGEVCVSGQCK